MLEARGFPNALDMSHGEIWTRMRLMRTLDALDAATATNAALLGARGTKQAVARRFAELGVE